MLFGVDLRLGGDYNWKEFVVTFVFLIFAR
jgi:hypothetical protein